MFNRDAKAFSGERWLSDRRAVAAEHFADALLPSSSEEEWRYGRIDELSLAEFALESRSRDALSKLPTSDVAKRFTAASTSNSCIARTVNGEIVSVELSSAARDAGVVVGRLSELTASPAFFDENNHDDALGYLSDAYFADALVIEVPDDVVLDDPIVVVHEVTAGDPKDAPLVVFPTVLLSIGKGARAALSEITSSDDARALVVSRTQMDIADHGALDYHSVQRLGAGTWQLSRQSSAIATGANFRSFVATLGGDYARTAISSSLDGENATSQLFAVYYGEGDEVQDFRTFQNHSAPRTKSELVFKGAVSDTARSVYTGMIRIDPGAVRSNASQTNRNLVLSEVAHADSVPNLDIAENDVKCTHASAVGPIDPEQRFYLETRGVPSDVADQLIVLGFFDDLLARVPNSAASRFLQEELVQRLSQ